MKNIGVFVTGIIFGIGIGAVGTFLWLQKDFKEKLDEEINKKVNEFDEFNKEKVNKMKEKPVENRKFSSVSNNGNISRAVTDKLGYTNYSGEASLIRDTEVKNDENYAPLLENESDACAIKSDALDDYGLEDSPPEDYFDAPEVITEQDYLFDKRHYSKETLIYYAGNDVFTDVCATFVDDASLLVGEKWRINIDKNDDGVVYVRNYKVATDYEILIENGSFVEDEEASTEGG